MYCQKKEKKEEQTVYGNIDIIDQFDGIHLTRIILSFVAIRMINRTIMLCVVYSPFKCNGDPIYIRNACTVCECATIAMPTILN